MGNRRRSVAFRLRIYIDAIRDAEKTTDQAWLDTWIQHGDLTKPFMRRSTWISILQNWAFEEAERISLLDAA